MITHSETVIPAGGSEDLLRYALIPVHGYGIAVATVARMLDDGTTGRARVLPPGTALPYGAHPIVLAETTVYGVSCVEAVLRGWGTHLPKPWLVLVSDAPARPVADVRYAVRALGARLAGVATVPYLPVLRAVKEPDEALEFKDVQAAAGKLRRALEGNNR
uniref:Uncharacterized protein n=1 Tax=Streptomyces lavendulae TaxID=1914 RepID=A0A1Q2SRM7_STRLA|nr:hypothetical protein [Streptomyces lavendulae]